MVHVTVFEEGPNQDMIIILLATDKKSQRQSQIFAQNENHKICHFQNDKKESALSRCLRIWKERADHGASCANALGQVESTMIIFEGKYLNHQWTVGEVAGTLYILSV